MVRQRRRAAWKRSGDLPLVDQGEQAMPAPAAAGRWDFATIAVTTVVVLGAVGLYAATGGLELPSAPASAPASARTAVAPESSPVEQLAALTAAQNWDSQPPRQAPARAQASLGSVDEMIARLAARLRRQPDDPEGWRLLGWSYLKTDRFADAAAAYRRAVEFDPKSASLRSALGEALVKAADGQVTAEAKTMFDHAFRLDPKDFGARYYRALAKAQAGDKAAAINDWIALLNDADPQDPWIADVMKMATEVGREAGIDVSSRLRVPRGPQSGGVLATLREREAHDAPANTDGPAAEDVRNADAMAPADRNAMIRGMVENLASRLEKTPRDVEGWIKLIRSRTVLGETEAARQALDRAMQVFDDDPDERGRIAAAGREFGLTPEQHQSSDRQSAIRREGP
jgi:cytochrome c-type biogenesis protein CcmH